MKTKKLSAAMCCLAALALPGHAISQRAQQSLPVPTWEITGDEDDLYGDYGCLTWPEVRFPLTPNEDPEYIDEDRLERDQDDDDDDRPSIRVDEDDRPIIDRAGNFIRCEVPPIAGWLNGTTLPIIGALIVGQIAIFAGGGGASAGNTNDSPG